MTLDDTAEAVRRSFNAYVDLRLAAAEVTPTPPAPSPLQLTTTGSEPARRPHAKLAAAAALVVLVAAGVVVAVDQTRHSTSATPQPSSSTPSLDLTTTHTTVGDFTFAHPAFLRWVPPGPPSAGPGSSAGYLTNAATVEPCTSSGPDANGVTSTTCGPPVTAPRPGQVVVSFFAVGLLPPDQVEQPNRTVAGLPATVSDQPPNDSCPSGGALAVIRLPTPDPEATVTSALEVSSCANDVPLGAFNIHRLLDTATYRSQ